MTRPWVAGLVRRPDLPRTVETRGPRLMSLLDRLKNLFSGGRLDVRSRFDVQREAISGTMSSFYVARERSTGRIVGLKILD